MGLFRSTHLSDTTIKHWTIHFLFGNVFKSIIVYFLNITNTVYSRYIVVGGVQAMVLRYNWERDICHEPKSDSILHLQRIMNDNGAFVCLATNSARRQLI